MCAYGCTSQPAWYAPPIQRKFSPATEPRAVGESIQMSDSMADTHIVSGVLGGEPGSSWRWANPRAELRFHLAEIKAQKFVIDFAIADDTFKLTGPVTMQFFIDGKRFAATKLDSPGSKHFETPVPEALLKVDTPVVVAAEVDKFYTSSHDGTKLGFILSGMGFQHQ